MWDARSFETIRLDIADDADNRQPIHASPKLKFDQLAERILLRPIPSRECLINHRDRACLIAIRGIEISPRH
jgi:hypothetical protein